MCCKNHFCEDCLKHAEISMKRTNPATKLPSNQNEHIVMNAVCETWSMIDLIKIVQLWIRSVQDVGASLLGFSFQLLIAFHLSLPALLCLEAFALHVLQARCALTMPCMSYITGESNLGCERVNKLIQLHTPIRPEKSIWNQGNDWWPNATLHSSLAERTLNSWKKPLQFPCMGSSKKASWTTDFRVSNHHPHATFVPYRTLSNPKVSAFTKSPHPVLWCPAPDQIRPNASWNSIKAWPEQSKFQI